VRLRVCSARREELLVVRMTGQNRHSAARGTTAMCAGRCYRDFDGDPARRDASIPYCRLFFARDRISIAPGHNLRIWPRTCDLAAVQHLDKASMLGHRQGQGHAAPCIRPEAGGGVFRRPDI
jgi:hypothetical protein